MSPSIYLNYHKLLICIWFILGQHSVSGNFLQDRTYFSSFCFISQGKAHKEMRWVLLSSRGTMTFLEASPSSTKKEPGSSFCFCLEQWPRKLKIDRKKSNIRSSIYTYFHTKNKKEIKLCYILISSLALVSLDLSQLHMVLQES